MQTSSQGQEATDTALVYRPPARTRCNPDVPLAAFDENDCFYPLWKYNQYHDSSRGVASDPALHKSFHLRIKDVMSKDATGCTATDNWQAFHADEYLFRDGNGNPVRGENLVVSSVSPVQPAVVKPEVGSARYSGLSSEIAYDMGGGSRLACFAFTMALPTKGLANRSLWDVFGPSQLKKSESAALSWSPTMTDLTVLQFNGRQTRVLLRLAIEWQQ